MKKLIVLIVLALLLTGCTSRPPLTNYIPEYVIVTSSAVVERIHDNELQATCWVYSSYKRGGISCIPDWQLIPLVDN